MEAATGTVPSAACDQGTYATLQLLLTTAFTNPWLLNDTTLEPLDGLCQSGCVDQLVTLARARAPQRTAPCACACLCLPQNCLLCSFFACRASLRCVRAPTGAGGAPRPQAEGYLAELPIVTGNTSWCQSVVGPNIVPLLQTTIPFLCQKNLNGSFCFAEVAQALDASGARPAHPHPRAAVVLFRHR